MSHLLSESTTQPLSCKQEAAGEESEFAKSLSSGCERTSCQMLLDNHYWSMVVQILRDLFQMYKIKFWKKLLLILLLYLLLSIIIIDFVVAAISS